MGTYICRDCDQPVNRGDAHVRSVNFEQVAFCPSCWVAHRAALIVPEPRLAPDSVREEAY